HDALPIFNLKRIGNLIFTLTALPLCFPGSQLGADLTTLIASSSQPPPIPLRISTSWIDPSVFTTNTTYTVPSIPILRAWVGYLRLLLKYLFQPSIPPGCVGIVSTTSKISSAFSTTGASAITTSLMTVSSLTSTSKFTSISSISTSSGTS